MSSTCLGAGDYLSVGLYSLQVGGCGRVCKLLPTLFSVQRNPKHLFVIQKLTQGVVMFDELSELDLSELKTLDLDDVATLDVESNADWLAELKELDPMGGRNLADLVLR